MSGLLNTLYPRMPHIPELINVALWVGSSAASAIILMGITKRTNVVLDWRDVALWGAAGSTIGAHFAITQKPWFYNRW
jgi:hypothetical protein